jgi:hypothetical protein
MALDHFVPQVHIRGFYSPKLGDRLYAMRKSDLATFTPNSRGVCAINGGSTNTYLTDERAIEEFLKTIEPNYNSAVAKLAAGKIDAECIYTIAGFIAYVASCSPAAMRIHTEPLKASLEATAEILDAKGDIPPAPPSLGGKTLTELLEAKEVKFTVDPKYPQALGIDTILSRTATFGNFEWEILHNEFDGNPFFTSDFPVALEETNDPKIVYRLVPLTPQLAVRIKPDISIDRRQADLSFAQFRYSIRKLARHEVVEANRRIVRSAEDTVFYRDDETWVKPFIVRNRDYRVECQTIRMPAPRGSFALSRQVLTRFQRT